jgi:hypothetical protein
MYRTGTGIDFTVLSRGRTGSSLHQNGGGNPYVLLTSVEDPHHLDADPDPSFHFDPDPDPTFTLKWIRIRIQLSTLILIRIQVPKMIRIRNTVSNFS